MRSTWQSPLAVESGSGTALSWLRIRRVAAHAESARGRRVIQAAAVGLGLALAVLSIHTGLIWTDGQVYWEAAQRASSGEPIYPGNADPDSAFKYAPWFAWVWIPMTGLSEPFVAGLWISLMLVAGWFPIATLLRGDWRQRSVALLAGPTLFVAALGGNVQPALVGLLFVGLERRWGPLAIAVAASLKLFPIFFALTYLSRREWTRAALAVTLCAVLWSSALLPGTGVYPAAIGGPFSLWNISPIMYLALVAAIGVWAWASRGWPSSSLLVLLSAGIRFVPYHLGYLCCAWPSDSQQADRSREQRIVETVPVSTSDLTPIPIETNPRNAETTRRRLQM